jgi:aspartyl-tRNA(Asn)/glutamyl-tRNA(Gln) amidotransferase subunit A
MDDLDLLFTPATNLRERYKRRDLSPVEVVEAVLARQERLNPILNAFLATTPDLALEAAREAERVYAAGDEPGLLAGIPISIKDNHALNGVRWTSGSLLYSDRIADSDSLFVERVKRAGGAIIGKTNMPEGGWKGASTNRLGEPTRNPWDLSKTPGGSSSGAAAAVASGIGPLAQGGDGAGSIRIPAGFCGVFGFKASYGTIAYPGTATTQMAHAGPLTRTVRDAALVLATVAGKDVRDRLSYDAGIDFLAACEGDIKGLRVAWSPDLGYAAVDPEVAEITARAAARLSELGAHVEEANPGLSDPLEILDGLWEPSQASGHQDDLDAVRDQLDPGRVAIMERGLKMRATDVIHALQRRDEYHNAMQRFMSNYDLLVTPQLPVTAFPVELDFPPEIAGRPMTYLGWTAFTYPFNLTGQPSATVPCGFAANGLPVALQFTGQWRGDATVLRAAAAYEEAFPWADRRPAVGE